MSTVKQIVREIADQLPEQATLDDAMYSFMCGKSWSAPCKRPGKAKS